MAINFETPTWPNCWCKAHINSGAAVSRIMIFLSSSPWILCVRVTIRIPACLATESEFSFFSFASNCNKFNYPSGCVNQHAINSLHLSFAVLLRTWTVLRCSVFSFSISVLYLLKNRCHNWYFGYLCGRARWIRRAMIWNFRVTVSQPEVLVP